MFAVTLSSKVAETCVGNRPVWESGVSSVQIFISYARIDDEPPPGLADAQGFVTYLHDQLLYEMKVLGQPQPKLWRDVRHVEPNDQFDAKIEQNITDSSILLVVLSRNWTHRPYCLRELTSFARRWKAEGEDGIKRRIVVVSKHFIKPEERPELLQGQQSFEFFATDGEAVAGQEKEFFYRGQVRDTRYENSREGPGARPMAHCRPARPGHADGCPGTRTQ